MLTDSFGRKIDYLRLAVTDRCNLRCTYCMPLDGIQWLGRESLLSFEEIMRAQVLFASLGITKMRFTGGEPFLRRDFMLLLRETVKQNHIPSVSITTNGTLTAPYLKELKDLGIARINLSLDTLDENRFERISRRKDFGAVMQTLEGLLKWNIPTRINAVIMEGINEEDIESLTAFTRNTAIDVRFIEEMPFNGANHKHHIKWTSALLQKEIERMFGPLQKDADEENATSQNYRISGHQGRVGFIPAFTRNFCGTCNRIRLTPTGQIKTCLYEGGFLDLRQLLRTGASMHEMQVAVTKAVMAKAADGREAEARSKSAVNATSMASIGG